MDSRTRKLLWVSCLLRLQDGESEVGFEYRKQRLCWDDAAGVFKALKFPDSVSTRLSWCRCTCARQGNGAAGVASACYNL